MKSEKTAPKVPTQSQVEVAKRLTQGMSSGGGGGKAIKPPTGQNSATNAVFQLDKDTYDEILAASEANSNMNNMNNMGSMGGMGNMNGMNNPGMNPYNTQSQNSNRTNSRIKIKIK